MLRAAVSKEVAKLAQDNLGSLSFDGHLRKLSKDHKKVTRMHDTINSTYVSLDSFSLFISLYKYLLLFSYFPEKESRVDRVVSSKLQIFNFFFKFSNKF